MSHVLQQKRKLAARLKRIKGQVGAVERALDNEGDCADILQLVAAARGGMNALMAELMADQLLNHVVEPEHGENPREAAQELISIIRTYLK